MSDKPEKIKWQSVHRIIPHCWVILNHPSGYSQLINELEFLDLLKTAPAELLLRADLAKPSEWISVDDRLPEDGGSFMVCLGNDMVTEFNFSNIGARPYWFKVGFGSEVDENKVTHWALLPPPPTRETP